MASSLKLSVNGRKYLVSGITRGTSCKDLLCALAKVASKEPNTSDVSLMRGYTSISANRLEKINEGTKSHRPRSRSSQRTNKKDKDKSEISPRNEKNEILKKDKSCEGLKKDKYETSNKKNKKSKTKDCKENKENKSKKSKIKGQKFTDRKCSVDDSDIERYKYRTFNRRVKRKAYDDSDVEIYQSLLSLVDSQSKQIKSQQKDMKISKTEWAEELRKESLSFVFVDIHENRPKPIGSIVTDLKDDIENDNDSGLPSLDYDSSREPSLKEDDILGRHDSGIGSETTHASPVIAKRSELICTSVGCDKGCVKSNNNSNNIISIKNNENDQMQLTESLKDKDCRTNGYLISDKERNCIESIAVNHTESGNVKNGIVTDLVHRFKNDEIQGNNAESQQQHYDVNKTSIITVGTDVSSIHHKPTLNCSCLEERREDMHKTTSTSTENMNCKDMDNLNKNIEDDLVDMSAERTKLWTEYLQTGKNLTDTSNELLYKDLILLQLEFEFKCLNEENMEFEDQMLAEEENRLLEELIGTEDLLRTVILLNRYQDHEASNNIRQLLFHEAEVRENKLLLDSLEKLIWRMRYNTAPRSLIKRCRTNPNLKGLISESTDDDMVETTFV